MSENRKRTDSETRVIRLTEPIKTAFDKSSSSDTKMKPMQVVRPANNPTSFTFQTHPPSDSSQVRRPNSEFSQLNRVTFDLKGVPLMRDQLPLPSTSLPVTNYSGNYYDNTGLIPGSLSASNSASSFSKVPLTYSGYIQPLKQPPSFLQS